MGDILEFPDKTEAYDRSCGECGASIFTWQTYDQANLLHSLECAECGEVYPLSVLENDD
jgi:hypothetical protein